MVYLYIIFEIGDISGGLDTMYNCYLCDNLYNCYLGDMVFGTPCIIISLVVVIRTPCIIVTFVSWLLGHPV